MIKYFKKVNICSLFLSHNLFFFINFICYDKVKVFNNELILCIKTINSICITKSKINENLYKGIKLEKFTEK